jgi:hypothetical protein
MKLRVTRIGAVALAGLALAGGGAAFAAAQMTSSDEQAVLDSAAERLGVESQELEDALRAAVVERIDAAVQAGDLTQEQANELKERVEAGDVPLFGGFGRFGHHGGPVGFHAIFDAAAEYLGVTEAELRDAREDGRSLADVAEDRGKSVNGLEQAMVAAATSELDEAVSEGRLTSAQRQEMIDELEARIGDMVQETGSPRGFGHRHLGPDSSVEPSDASWTLPAAVA